MVYFFIPCINKPIEKMSSESNKSKYLRLIQEKIQENSSRFVTPRLSSVYKDNPSLSFNMIYTSSKKGWKINSEGKGTPMVYINELSLWFDENLFIDVDLINPN